MLDRLQLGTKERKERQTRKHNQRGESAGIKRGEIVSDDDTLVLMAEHLGRLNKAHVYPKYLEVSQEFHMRFHAANSNLTNPTKFKYAGIRYRVNFNLRGCTILSRMNYT